MGFNNKKTILSQILAICIFSSLVGANVYEVNAENQDYTVEVSTDNGDNTNDTIITTSVENIEEIKPIETTSIIKKFDFEYELQVMIDTYKNIQEVEKSQAKIDTLDFLEQLLNSTDYSIDEKKEIGNSALNNAVLNNIIQVNEAVNVKQSFYFELNKQADRENLNTTIENILNSTVSISSKRDFCANALELSKLSKTITEYEYTSKLAEVEEVLNQQQILENERLAKEEAERLAREEQARIEAEIIAKKQAEQQALQEKAQAKTVDTSIDVSTLQTMPITAEDENEASEKPENIVGFGGSLTYNEKDFLALCNVVQHEVGNCSTLSKKMVASVIVNRAISGIFPSSIYDVVNQENQFTGISAFIDRTDYATEDTIYWCKYVLDNGIDYSNGALFYYAPQWCGYMSYFENMTLVAECDGQRYFIN